jgi:hypothetical protein
MDASGLLGPPPPAWSRTAIGLLLAVSVETAIAQPLPPDSCVGTYATSMSQMAEPTRNRGGIVLAFTGPSNASVYLLRGNAGYNNPRPTSLAGYEFMGNVSITARINGNNTSYLFSFPGKLGIVDASLTPIAGGYGISMTPRGMGTATGTLTCARQHSAYRPALTTARAIGELLPATGRNPWTAVKA